MLVRFLTGIVERIVAISDYFIFEKRISLSEGLLFLVAALRTPWFIFLGVNQPSYDYIFPDFTWILIFAGLSGAHFAAFFFKSLKFRCAVVCLYGSLWLFLAIIAGLNRTTSPAIPTLLPLAFASSFLADLR